MVSRKKAKILVVDDVVRNLSMIEAILTPHGYEVVVAHNGLEAVEIACSQKPDLILLDILMPGMSGPDIAKNLSGDPKTKEIPVIFLTAIVTKEETGMASFKEIGGHHFIAKPIETAKLVSIMKGVLEKKIS